MVQDAQPPAAAWFIATRIPWSCEEGMEQDTRQEMSCSMDAMLPDKNTKTSGKPIPMILTWRVVGKEVGSILAESSPQGT